MLTAFCSSCYSQEAFLSQILENEILLHGALHFFPPVQSRNKNLLKDIQLGKLEKSVTIECKSLVNILIY